MGLLPVLQEVMPYMIALAQKLTEIIGALFGVEKAANAVSSSLGGADYSSISQATESENELGDAIEETDKKLKKSLPTGGRVIFLRYTRNSAAFFRKDCAKTFDNKESESLSHPSVRET